MARRAPTASLDTWFRKPEAPTTTSAPSPFGANGDGVLAAEAGVGVGASAGGLEAFVALYDQDTRVFDSWGRWAYQGTDEWRGMAAELFGSLGNEKMAVEFHDLQTVSGDHVAAWAGVGSC